MDWDDVRYFLALARQGSVRAAGASLGTSHSTVLRRVESLEERLHTRLFDRNRDGYSLTEAGQQVVPSAEAIEAEMASIERSVAGADERLEGPVSFTTFDNYIARLLLRELGPFCGRHPAIDLQVTVDFRMADLSRREADIAVRAHAAGAKPADHLVGKLVAPLVVSSYVAREHADRLDPSRGARGSRWLRPQLDAGFEAIVASSPFPDLPQWGSFSTFELLMEAAIQGHGIVMAPTYVGDSEPSLVRLAVDDRRHMGDLWLLYHPDLRSTARIRAARAALTAAFERLQPLFAGDGPETGQAVPNSHRGDPPAGP